MQYLVLLRGINVGGNNIIKMADLRACLEKHGCSEVKTYIQSGNVIINTKEKDITKETARLEKLLSKEFNYQSTLVLLTKTQMQNAVDSAPKGFGKEPENYRYNVIFLKEPLKSSKALEELSLNPGVDFVVAGSGLLYHSYPIAKASKSHISRISKLPLYKSITIRNWNTTTKLLALLNES